MKLYSRSTYINKKLYSLLRLTSSKRFHDIFDPDQSAICSLIVEYCFVSVRRHNLSCCYRSIPSTGVLGEIKNVYQTYWLCYDSNCHFLIFNSLIKMRKWQLVVWPSASRFADWLKRRHVTFIIIGRPSRSTVQHTTVLIIKKATVWKS